MEAILKQGLESLGLDTAAIPALTEYARRLLEKNKVMKNMKSYLKFIYYICAGQKVNTINAPDCL